MGTAQNQRVDAGVAQRRQILTRYGFDHAVAHLIAPVLHQGNEQRAGLADDLHTLVQRMDGTLIRAGADRGGGGNQADALIARLPYRAAAGRLHHTQNRQVIFCSQRGQGRRRHGAAGDNNRFDIKRAQKTHILPAVLEQNFLRAAAIRDTGRVTEVYNVFRGENAPHLAHGSQSAQPGVKHPDRSVIHGIFSFNLTIVLWMPPLNKPKFR